MLGLGKPRSKFGKWLDKNGVTQLELEQAANLSRGTVSRVCSDDTYKPKLSTISQIITGLKTLGKSVKQEDFWM